MTLRPILVGMALVVAVTGGPVGAFQWRAHAADETVQESAASKTWYTCGMHPEVTQDHPGNCPKCGMKLQPMTADRAAAIGLTDASASAPAAAQGTASKNRKVLYWKSSMSPGEIHDKPGKDSMGMDLIPVYEGEAAAGTIQIDPVVVQDMGVRVDTVKRGPLAKTVRTVGFVDYDETTLTVVTTKVDGWVEKLYVNQTGAQVHEGEPLIELYSPALFSAQEEYRAALRNLQKKDMPLIPRSRGDSEALVRDARTRLEYFDISPEQIAELERTGTVRKTLTIRAPFTGIVTQKNVVKGQRIMAGMEVFRIGDLSTVWVIAKVYEYDLPYVRLGQEAFMTLDYLPGRTFRGRVTYVYPYLDAKSREVSARMEFHNPGYELKPGMYATVTLVSRVADEATLVPDVAVIDTGTRSVVFVTPKPGRFEAREVIIGRRAEHNELEVLSGLEPGETVVVSGQFLLDSESRLREAALKFMEPSTVNGAAPIKDATAHAAAAAHPQAAEKAAAEGELYYVCPMPGHTDILYDKPGTCPLCGMTLVPVRRHAGHVESPHIAYWTCPMPEHSFIHKPGPGKCPLCGMSLIPVPEAQAEKETPAPHPHAADTESVP